MRLQLTRFMASHRLLISLLATLSAACWGIGTVISRAALETWPPFSLLAVQLGASVVLLGLIAASRGQLAGVSLTSLRDGWPGLLEPGLAYLFGIVGLSLTSASNTTLIGAIEPLLILGFAWWFLREPLTWRLALLALVGCIGVIFVSFGDQSNLQTGSLPGDGLILLGTATAALYVVVTRRLLGRRDPLLTTLIQQVVGFAGVMVVWGAAAWWQLPVAALPVLPWTAVLLAVISGMVQYALAFWLYLIALRHLRATIAAFYLTLIPLFGMAGAYCILGERLGWHQIIGALCILIPVLFLAQYAPTEAEGSH